MEFPLPLSDGTWGLERFSMAQKHYIPNIANSIFDFFPFFGRPASLTIISIFFMIRAGRDCVSLKGTQADMLNVVFGASKESKIPLVGVMGR